MADSVSTRQSADGIQLVSVTYRFKFEAPDGKQWASDALDTDKIDDRETFMKGIDYSYYYEQAE